MKFTTTVVGTTSDICLEWRAFLAVVTKGDNGFQCGSDEVKGKACVGAEAVTLFEKEAREGRGR